MLERFDRQTLLDYKRWEDSGELHYQSYETRCDFSSGSWDECPGLFLPDKVLDTCFRANPVPSPEQKVRANIDELEKKAAKKPDCVKTKVQTSKGNETETTRRSDRKRKQPAKLLESGNSPNNLAHVGTVVDILWTQEELDGTNWKPGWYRGEVQQYDEDDDLLYILYFKDHTVFSLNATGAFSDGIIHAVS